MKQKNFILFIGIIASLLLPSHLYADRSARNSFSIWDDDNTNSRSTSKFNFNWKRVGGHIYVEDIKEGDVKIPSTINSYPVTNVDFSNAKCTSVYLPHTVQVITGGDGLINVFSTAKNLKEITIHDYNPKYAIVDNILYDKSLTTLYSVPTARTKDIESIPATVTEVHIKNCPYIKSVKIPNSVTSMYLEGCTSLETVNVPSTVTSMDGTFKGCTSLKAVNIPSSVMYMNRTFEGCTSLKTVNIPSSVKELTSTFAGCTSLTTVDMPSSITSMSHTFEGCTSLTEIMVPASVNKASSPFLGCKNLKKVEWLGPSYFFDFDGLEKGTEFYYVGNLSESSESQMKEKHPDINFKKIAPNVKPIDSKIYYLKFSVRTNPDIPVEILSIKTNSSKWPTLDKTKTVFEFDGRGDYDIIVTFSYKGHTFNSTTNLRTKEPKFLLKVLKVGQTYIEAEVTAPSDASAKLTEFGLNYDMKADSHGIVKFSGLKPGMDISVCPYGKYTNGEVLSGDWSYITTKSLNLYVSGEAGPTSFTAEGSWTEGDAKIDAYGFATGIDVAALTNQRRYTMGCLDPKTTTKIAFGVAGPWGAEWTEKAFTTAALTWETPGATATSLSSARMMVETNCDAETGTGFEWRRIDAPELVPSTKAPCPVVDGQLVGSLRNLNPETYYKFRPYYTSASGKTYYGEWTGLFTGDANVYFEPEVRTFGESLSEKRVVRLSGYALAGSDDITEQGFQYRAVGKAQGKARAAEAWQSVAAKGIKMEATLDDLAYGTTYRYRAYAVTAKGTFYGDEREFSTEAESGIEDVVTDAEEGLTVALRENPATGTAWLRIVGSDAAEVVYRLTSVSGATVATGTLAADGTWQPVELTVPAGLYLLTVNDATAARTVRLVVR